MRLIYIAANKHTSRAAGIASVLLHETSQIG